MKGACLAIALVLAALAGCERSFRDMYDQPRYKPLARSTLWSDERASRPAVSGTQPHSEGTPAGASSGRLGLIAPQPAPAPLDAIRDPLRPPVASAANVPPVTLPPFTPALLDRGRERFEIFCAPCHGLAGDGDGMVVRRGFPRPPSFHVERLRDAGDAHFYAVITDGYGAMHPYATRIAPPDRLAIIAYIRALQLSQHAPLASLADEDRARLSAVPPTRTQPGATR